MKNLPLWFSRRLSQNSKRTKSGTGTTGAVIAVMGVAFALAVMEITLAVTVGFKHEITAKLDGFVAPVTVTAPSGEYESSDNFVRFSPELVNPITDVVPEATVNPFLSQSGMLKTDEDFAAILLKGYENDYPATFERSNMIEGEWISADDTRTVVISAEMARKLGLRPGNRVNVCFFVDNAVKARPFTVSGIYESGLSEYDGLVAYTSADAIRKVNHLDSGMISGVELRNIAMDDSKIVSDELADAYVRQAVELSDGNLLFNVSSVAEEGSMYLSWLDLLDTNVVVIFILMTLVAASTLISSLFIQVLEKVNAIGLLRAIGARNRLVSMIFVYLSLRLVGLGVIIGNVLGLGLIAVQSYWCIFTLDPEMYYLNYVPVEISFTTIIILNVAVIAAAWLMLIVPAGIATRLSPARTLRFD